MSALKLSTKEIIEKFRLTVEENAKQMLIDSEEKVKDLTKFMRQEKDEALLKAAIDANAKNHSLQKHLSDEREKALDELEARLQKEFTKKVENEVKKAVQMEQDVFSRLQKEFKAKKREWKEEKDKMIQAKEDEMQKREAIFVKQLKDHEYLLTKSKHNFEKQVSDTLFMIILEGRLVCTRSNFIFDVSLS